MALGSISDLQSPAFNLVSNWLTVYWRVAWGHKLYDPQVPHPEHGLTFQELFQSQQAGVRDAPRSVPHPRLHSWVPFPSFLLSP